MGGLLDPCPLCWEASIYCWAGEEEAVVAPGGGGYPGAVSQSWGQDLGELNVTPIVGRRNPRIKRALICLKGPGFGPQALWPP